MSREMLDKLLKQANELEDSPAKVEILEECVRTADVIGDSRESFGIRLQLISTACISGQDERAFIAISWCLHDDDKSHYNNQELLQNYGYIIDISPEFYKLSLSQIRQLQEDFRIRLESSNFSLREYYRIRADYANKLGFTDERKRFLVLWRAAKGVGLFEKEVLQCLSITDAVIDGDYSNALSLARPVLTGKMTDWGFREHTYAELINVSLQHGDLQRAESFYALGYPLAVKQTIFLTSIRWYLAFLTRIADIARGQRLVERHIPVILQRISPLQRMKFLSVTASFFERVHELAPQSRKVRFPVTLSVHSIEGRYDPFELTSWFRERAGDLAREFDNRNGNAHVSWELAKERALSLGLPIPEYPNEPPPADEFPGQHDAPKKPSGTRPKWKLEKLP